MIAALTWKWGSKYSAQDVNRWARGIVRHTRTPTFPICITDDAYGLDSSVVRSLDIARLPDTAVVQRLLQHKDGCYARLVMFSEGFERLLGAAGYDRMFCTDLDAVITGDLPALVPQNGFAIAYGIHYIACRYNGSIMAWSAGARRDLWADFQVHVADAVAYDVTDTEKKTYWGTDQSWIWHKRRIDDIHLTPSDGVYGFMKPGWPPGPHLPSNARVVFFPGARDPRDPAIQQAFPWIKENWS